MNKTIGLGVLVALVCCSLALAAGTQDAGKAAMTLPETTGELHYTTLVVGSPFAPTTASGPYEPIIEQALKDKFNVVVDKEYVPSSGWEQLLRLRFATGEEPDLNYRGSSSQDLIDELGTGGYLVALDPYLDRLPDYRKLFKDDEWKVFREFADSPDGHLYTIGGYATHHTQQCWIYRKSAFDQLKFTFPLTTDQLYTTLVAIKRADPGAIPISNRGGLGGMKVGFELAFRVQTGHYLDPDTKQFIFGPKTQKYRDMLIYMNKLYQEDLIFREFATADYNTWVQQVANNKPYIMFEYAARIAWANDAVKAVDPNTVWAAPKDFAHVTAYPNLGGGKPLTLWYLPYWYPAMWMSAKNSPEKIARMLKVWNWYATDEGVLLTNMGVEGKTFQWVNGHAQYMPHIQTTANPSGTVPLGKYGLAYMLNYHLDHLAQTGAGVTNELSKKVEEYDHIENIKLAYNKTELTAIADYETMVRDVTNEHVLKFIMGQLNPSSDADWKAFMDALTKANFDRVDAIKQTAYARKYK